MMKITRNLLPALLLVCVQQGFSQKYQYTADLNIKNDKLQVSLITPATTKSTVIFAMPKIIPGTYSIADYGKFVSNVKATGKNGNSLPVKKLNDNQWQISNAAQLNKITYDVDDIFDAEIKHNIYPMAATNFEADNIVLNTPGIFGFIDGMQQLPFEVTFEKPAAYYASTSLAVQSKSPTRDMINVRNVDELYDHP